VAEFLVFDPSTSRYKQDTNVKGELGETVALAMDRFYDRANFDMSIATADFPSLDELAEDPGWNGSSHHTRHCAS
jgi:hypothetical protein